VANIAFAAALIVRPSLAPPMLRQVFVSRESQAAAAAAADVKAQRARTAAAEASARAAALSQTRLWTALQSDDLRALIERLRAAGFPPNVVRAVVSSEVDQRFAARIKALQAQVEEVPYWQPASTSSFNNPKYFEERQQVSRDRSKLMRELLGDQAFAAAGMDPTALQRQQFGDLPKAKIELVQRINEDYAEMTSQVRAATAGIVLPEDRAKLALLEREKRADLAAVLSPQELEDYEMRTSPVTMRLRGALTLIDANEEEFRTIYRLSQPYADVLYPNSVLGMVSYSSEYRQKREDATQALNAQVKSALGEARYAEWTRAQNYEFQNLARLAQGQGLPLTTAVQAYNLRTSTTEASERIGDNKALSAEQKLVALRELAQNTKNQLTTALGPSANSYVQTAEWLKAIEKGYVVKFSADGTSTSFRMIGPSTPQPPPR
jgi:DNA-binding transcriptional MerR regulator